MNIQFAKSNKAAHSSQHLMGCLWSWLSWLYLLAANEVLGTAAMFTWFLRTLGACEAM
jgi:hypothetical protein